MIRHLSLPKFTDTTHLRALVQVALPVWLMGCLSLTAWAQNTTETQVTGAKVTEVGIYESRVATTQTNSVGLKFAGSDNFKLITSTTNIPAKIGTVFGFRYEISGTPSNAPIILMMITVHPPLTNAATGEIETNAMYRLKSWIGQTYMSCSLDEQSDCVPGPWHFEVWHERTKLCEQSFLVVPGPGKN